MSKVMRREDLDREDLLEELKLCCVSGHLSSRASAQLRAIVEQHFSEGHLIPMGNGASQCKYCGASFLLSYTEESDE